MSVRFKFDGLADLKVALRNMPAELVAESGEIVFANADAAAREVEAAYPVRQTGLHPGPRRKSPWFPPGSLKARVYAKREPRQFGATSIVKNNAPHAWLYDNGSQARRWDNGKLTGAMPPTHLFVRTMMRRRRIMYQILKDLLVSKGLMVSGDA